MHKNEADDRLEGLALKMMKYQADIKVSQRQLVRWTLIRQQKGYYRWRSSHLRHWSKMQMRHLAALKKKMQGLRTEVIVIKAMAKEASK